jgi:hypothetical protein
MVSKKVSIVQTSALDFVQTLIGVETKLLPLLI